MDPHSEWLHPIKEFALLMSLIGVVSLGYELFLRELTFGEYKEALQEIVNPDAVRLGIEGIYKNRSELGQSMSFESLFRQVDKEVFVGGSSLLSIATSSGARYCDSAEALDATLNALDFSTVEEEISEYTSLWQTWLILGCLVALLTVEWVVRKTSSMP